MFCKLQMVSYTSVGALVYECAGENRGAGGRSTAGGSKGRRRAASTLSRQRSSRLKRQRQVLWTCVNLQKNVTALAPALDTLLPSRSWT